MIEENKVTLAHQRAELVEKLATALPPEVRVRFQGELSVLNAKIKALHTTEAAQLKAAADRRKAAGLAEAQANAVRARAKLDGAGETDDGDPGQIAAVDAWVVAVLQRCGVKVRRARDGALDLFDAPAKWVTVVDALRDGLHAAARGQELPEITPAEAKKAKRHHP